MAKTGLLSSDSTVRARAVELKKELQRLVRTLVDDEDYSIHTIDQAKDALCALRELKFNKRPTATTTTTSSLKLHEAVSCPEEFRCPLSKELMRDPVILASGQTYDRPFIQKWLNAGNRTCPSTQQVLSHTLLTPNHLIREMILQWCKSQGIELPDPFMHGKEEGVTEAERDHFFSLLEKLSAALPEQKEAAKELRLLTKRMPSFRKIIHCDIKSQNILLDEQGQAKISDFGLAKLLKPDQTKTITRIRGTRGYVAPEWHRKLPVTVKADVYSFGIVLLEIICCRRSLNWSLCEEEAVLEEWVYNCYQVGEVRKIVGEDEEVDGKLLERMVMVGLWCILDEPTLRPSMKKVLLMLEGTVEIPIPPSPNSFFSSI